MMGIRKSYDVAMIIGQIALEMTASTKLFVLNLQFFT